MIELGIVEREFSVDAKANERVNVKRGIYRIADNFFRFWYTFGFNNFSQLEDGDVEGVYEYLVKPELNEFISVTFEDVCRQFVKELQKRNELPFRYSEIGRWIGKTTIPDKNNPKGFKTDETEIDLLCRDKNGTKYLLGECKYKKSPFDFSEYQRLLGKFAAEKKKANVYYALFSGAGFDEKIIKEAKGNSLLHLYDLDDIVEPTLY